MAKGQNGLRIDVSDPKHKIRCAIYTRKSTEEGLEQEFNSLDAQRESAEAYISSMKNEGWVCLPEVYDDGGFSGGTIERPALKRLMADVEAGEIDVVVVYKVDRLSRSLLDFSRLMETFEQHNVSFVSVTQQFSTTNSMGRLTLNILLSFAQFEREIISERTRDKMSAARKKGKWVGGMPVLGYDVAPRGGRILMNKREGERVRAIYELYLERMSLMPVVQELDRRGWKTKQWITKKGQVRGGKPFDKSTLFRLLTNIIYTGKVNYKGAIYSGEHDAIIAPEVWQKVQDVLHGNGRGKGAMIRNKYGALLKGLLYCDPCGTAMTHTYVVKNEKRYRYYVCLNAQKRGYASCPSKSLNAQEIEREVVKHIRGVGKNEGLIAETIGYAKERTESNLRELEREQVLIEKELKRLHDKLRKLVEKAIPRKADGSLDTDHLADLQDQIRNAEQRMNHIKEEIAELRRGAVDEQEVAKELAAFDHIWDSLNSSEQARLLNVLIERIGYDGATSRVSISFKSFGIKQMVSDNRDAENQRESNEKT